MRYFIGLDVGLRTTSVCVVDPAGGVVKETSVETEPVALAAALRPFRRTCIRLGLEAGALSEWLHQALAKAGFPVICIEARHAHLVLQANTNKTDRNDAKGIANLMRTGVYRTVHVKSPESQRIRALLNIRRTVQIKVIDIENAIGGILRSFGVKLPRTGARTFETKVAALLGNSAELATLIRPLIDIRRFLREHFDRLDAQIVRAAREDPVCRRLMTAPGIGPIAALTYRSVIDVPARFHRSQMVGAHLGLTPRTKQSGGSDRRGRISKRGDRGLRTALYSGANAVLHPQCHDHPLRAWALGIAARSGRKKAIIALARRLAVILHRMWCDGTDYRPGPVMA